MGSWLLVQDLVAMDVGQRHLGGGDQVEVEALDLEQVFLELGQVAGADQAEVVDQEGRQHFAVTVLGRVHVEHELDQHALQLGQSVEIEGEARAGDLGGALEIEAGGPFAQFPVRPRGEAEPGFFPPAAHDFVVPGILAHRDRVMEQVGDVQQKFLERRFHGLQLAFVAGDQLGQLDGLQLQLAGAGAAFFLDAGLLGQAVFPALQLLAFGQQPAAQLIDLAEARLVKGDALGLDLFPDQFQVVPDKIDVQHKKIITQGFF